MPCELSPLRPLRIAPLPSGRAGGPQGALPGQEPLTQAGPGRLSIALFFGVSIVAGLLWVFSSTVNARTVRDLPTSARAALCERTRDNLRDLCGGKDRPREFCREQANLLLTLQECDAECQAAAREEILSDSAVK